VNPKHRRNKNYINYNILKRRVVKIMKERWEYKSIDILEKDWQIEANKLGREGWEIIKIPDTKGAYITLYFKRRLP